MNTINNQNNIYFSGKLGKNLINYLSNNDFKEMPAKLKKFEKLFHDTFSKNIDNDTVLDRTNAGNFIMYHIAFPKYKVPVKLLGKETIVSKKILQHSTPYTFGYAENLLFEKIVADNINKGKTFEELEKYAKQTISTDRLENFLDKLNTARRIKQENPNSKLTGLEFMEMEQKEFQEILEANDGELIKILEAS